MAASAIGRQGASVGSAGVFFNGPSELGSFEGIEMWGDRATEIIDRIPPGVFPGCVADRHKNPGGDLSVMAVRLSATMA